MQAQRLRRTREPPPAREISDRGLQLVGHGGTRSRRDPMRRIAVKVVSLALVVALAGAVAARAGGGHHGKGSGRTLTVIEHATTDTTTDTGAKDDSAGDILTFANQVFDRADAHPVGTAQGYCIR